MNYRVLCIVLLMADNALGAFERMPQGGRPTALGGATLSLPRDSWAAFSNPGLLPTVDERFLSVFYVPQQFGLKELARGSFSYVEPTSLGTFSLSGQRFGFELYREVTVSASFGRSISDAVHVGLNLTYNSLSIQNYGSAGTVGLDLGALIQITDQVWWGVAAFNVNAPTIGQAKERLPQVFASGLTYAPISDGRISVALMKDVRFPTELKLGVEYTIISGVDLRGGMSGEPSTLNAGLGLRYGFVQLDYAFSEHSDLGAGHQISISFALGDL